MNQKTHDLLKKITYIEVDIEIQKQILFSIPSDRREDMERVIQTIAAQKEEIAILRRKINEISPDEHNRIIQVERAVNSFKTLAATNRFTSITTLQPNSECQLSCKNGEHVACLVKACDDRGDWTIITLDGQIRHIPGADVDPLA